MSFINCINDQFKERKLSKEQVEQIQKQYNEEFKAQKDGGLSDTEADLKAQKIVESNTIGAEAAARNKVRAAIRQDKVIKDLEKRMLDENISSTKAVSDLYQQTAFRKESVKAELYSLLNKTGDTLSGGLFELKKDYQSFKDAIRHLHGEVVESQGARVLGDSIKNVYDYSSSRFRAAGGIMGKIDNYFPQVHSKQAIRKVSKDEWVNDVYKRLDRKKMISKTTGEPLTDEQILRSLDYIYEDIISDGVYSLKTKFDDGDELAFGRGDIDKKRNQSRFIHFKSVDDFFEYNSKYGSGDEGLIQSFLSSMDGVANDIAMLEKLSTRPDALSKRLNTFMEINDKNRSARRGWVDAQYRILRGEHKYGNPDSLWWKVLTGTQNVMRSAMLGSASLSAISDTAFIAATAKINGLSSTKALSNYLKIVAGDKDMKTIARRSGYLADLINGAALSDTRFAGEMASGGTTGWLASMTNKMSGLQRMTDAAGVGIMLEGFTTVAEQVKKGVDWDSLDLDFRTSLERFDIKKGEWDNLKKAGLTEIDEGIEIIIPNELRLSENLDSNLSASLADKLDDWANSLKQQATNEGLLSTRAITTGAAFGNGSAGSMGRAFSSSLFMFKTFPITGMMTHLLPAIRRARVHRKYDHLAMVTLATTMIGGMAIQVKNLVKGKSTEDMENYGFWSAAFLQGGGLGLFGDFFLGDYSRFGRNPVTELTGPMGGLMADVLGATKGNFDKSMEGKELKNFKRDVFRLLKRNMPLQNLWYTRLLLERTMFDNIERMLDPNFDKRMRKYEKKMMQSKGQNFWWNPTKSSPELDKMIGQSAE